MPIMMPAEDPPTVRKIAIVIGDENFSADFGVALPHAEAMRRLRIMLSTFDRSEPEQPA